MAPQGLKTEFWSSENWVYNAQIVRNPLQITDILKIVKYGCFLRLTSSQKMSFYGPFEGFPVAY